MKKETKIFTILLCMIFCISAYGNVTVRATASRTYSVKITRYAQEKTNWCWCACAQMVGKHYGKNISQKKICKKVKGNTENNKASDTEVNIAIDYATGKTWGINASLTVNKIVKNLSKGDPLVIRIEWNNGGGHVYVLSQISTKGGSVPDDYVLLIDSWGNTRNKLYSLTALKKGTTLDTGKGKYDECWIRL